VPAMVHLCRIDEALAVGTELHVGK
jgi:hypothetical protein